VCFTSDYWNNQLRATLVDSDVRLKILVVQRFDLRNIACARRIIAIVRELLSRGHAVTVTQLPHQARQQNLPILHSLTEIDGANLVDLPRGGMALAGNVKRVCELASEHDIIHLWKCYPDAALPALWAALKRDKPVHYDWDDWEEGIASEMTRSAVVHRLTRLWERRVLEFVDTVSVASEALRRRAFELGFPSDRIFDAPVGADFSVSQSERVLDPERPRLVYVGQLEVAAYAGLAIEALERVCHVRPQASLVLVGGGRYLAELQKMVDRKGLNEKVLLTGYRPSCEVREFLANADVGLAPFEETPVTRAKSPLKVVEYLAAGLPIVGSHVGEVPTMIGNAGRTVVPDDPDAFAQAILDVLASPERWQGYSREARRRVQEVYNWSHTTDEILRAYEKAIEG